jgi:hypothetical protein
LTFFWLLRLLWNRLDCLSIRMDTFFFDFRHCYLVCISRLWVSVFYGRRQLVQAFVGSVAVFALTLAGGRRTYWDSSRRAVFVDVFVCKAKLKN